MQLFTNKERFLEFSSTKPENYQFSGLLGQLKMHGMVSIALLVKP